MRVLKIRMTVLVLCLLAAPHAVLASANSLFVEAFEAWEAAQNAASPLERFHLLQACQLRLDKIVSKHPSHDLAVKIITRAKVGEFDIGKVGEALVKAQREAEEIESDFDLNENLRRVITILRDGDLDQAWKVLLDSSSKYLDLNTSEYGVSRIIPWRIEQAARAGDISESTRLVQIAMLTGDEYKLGFDGSHDSELYGYVVEALLHTGHDRKASQLLRALDEDSSTYAYRKTGLYAARNWERARVEKFLDDLPVRARYGDTITDALSALIRRGWADLAEETLAGISDERTRQDARLEMASQYVDLGDVERAANVISKYDVQAADRPWVGPHYGGLLLEMAVLYHERGESDWAQYYFERAASLGVGDSSNDFSGARRDSFVAALARMGRIEEAREMAGLVDRESQPDLRLLSAYFKNLPTDLAVDELSDFEGLLTSDDLWRFFVGYLLFHGQTDTAYSVAKEKWNSPNVSNDALVEAFRIVISILQDPQDLRRVETWMAEVEKSRPGFDYALVVMGNLASLDAIFHKMNGIGAIASIPERFEEYFYLGREIVLSEDLNESEKRKLVAKALEGGLKAIIENNGNEKLLGDSRLRDILFLAQWLRSTIIDSADLEYRLFWPR